MKKLLLFMIMTILCVSCSISPAERKTTVKDPYYLGAMRVVNCRESVSLRELPDKTSDVLDEVPLGAIVYNCSNNIKKYAHGKYRLQYQWYIKCEYEGQEGYILKKFLRYAPEFEPPETKISTDKMAREEILGTEEDQRKTVLDWKEDDLSVLATHETKAGWEYLRIGCFDEEEPVWGYTEGVKTSGQTESLKVFMGGTEEEPQVYLYDAGYGLTMIDLMEGEEVWTLQKGSCPLGDAAAVAVDEDSGTLYIAGTDGPDPVAITNTGFILWQSETDDPEAYGPKEIRLNPDEIEVSYESGQIVTFDYDGELLQISDET